MSTINAEMVFVDVSIATEDKKKKQPQQIHTSLHTILLYLCSALMTASLLLNCWFAWFPIIMSLVWLFLLPCLPSLLHNDVKHFWHAVVMDAFGNKIVYSSINFYGLFIVEANGFSLYQQIDRKWCEISKNIQCECGNKLPT